MLTVTQEIGRRFQVLFALLFCLGLSACTSLHAYKDRPADDYRAANDALRRVKVTPGTGTADVARDDLVVLGIDGEQMTVKETLEYARYAVLDAESAEHKQQKRAVLMDVMARTGLESEVTVSTEKPGAEVYYQLLTDDEIHQFGASTPSAESLPIGVYYFWTRRNTWQNSPKVAYRIVDPQVAITLHEGQPGVVHVSNASR